MSGDKESNDLLDEGKAVDSDKKFRLGQYFTKKRAVEKAIQLTLEYKNFDKDIDVLEPGFGTGNFVNVLREMGFENIDGCEVDKTLFDESIDIDLYKKDFFELPLYKKYNLIIGNPPFSKYNLKKSYYRSKNYLNSSISPSSYLNENILKKDKIKLENAFILKSIKHLRDKDSAIGFVLPISFFIKNKNPFIKKKIKNYFSTVVIYQDDESWFDYDIPCCFTIFCNVSELKDDIILLYDGDEKKQEVIDLNNIFDEIIPKTYIFKKNFHRNGVKLKEYLKENNVKYQKSFKNNTVSASNILEFDSIPSNQTVEDYELAICRVGNASVGRAGLVNVKKEVLNDMFYVFSFKKKYSDNKRLKEKVCEQINNNQDYLKNITIRVGSKSIKKKDIMSLKIEENIR